VALAGGLRCRARSLLLAAWAAAVPQTKSIAAIVNVLASVIGDRSYHFVIAVWRAKEAESLRVKYR